MESDADDPGNIFEEYETRENEDRGEDGANAAESSTGVRVQPPKRVVKHPRLKFNPERLCGERGIPVLMDHFKNVKFKGKGHEKEDLDKLMATLEHWTHRLFPSMKFEDSLRQIEKLGKKRPVQTCLTKIRLDMPILNSDFVREDEEDNVQRNDDPDPELIADPFDRLIAESQDVLESNIPSSLSYQANYISPTSNDAGGQVLGSSFSTTNLSEEQKERMERNRMLAAERRKAKLAALQKHTSDTESSHDNAKQSQDVSSAFDDFLKSTTSTNTTNNVSDNANINLDKECSNENINNISAMSDNKNSENLSLDDLVDLVDEEDPVSEKHDDNVSEDIFLNNTIITSREEIDDGKIHESSSLVLQNQDLENNMLDDMDLVDNESVSKKNDLIEQSLDNENHIDISPDETVLRNNSTRYLDMESTLKIVVHENPESNKGDESTKDEIFMDETVPINVSRPYLNMDSTLKIVEHQKAGSNKVFETAKDELLELESMMDLVDEEEE